MLDISVVLKSTQHNTRIAFDAPRKGNDGSHREGPFASTHVVLIKLRVYQLVLSILVRLLFDISCIAIE